jgi:hypothetical protein
MLLSTIKCRIFPPNFPNYTTQHEGVPFFSHCMVAWSGPCGAQFRISTPISRTTHETYVHFHTTQEARPRTTYPNVSPSHPSCQARRNHTDRPLGTAASRKITSASTLGFCLRLRSISLAEHARTTRAGSQPAPLPAKLPNHAASTSRKLRPCRLPSAERAVLCVYRPVSTATDHTTK